eukprot:GGOE01030409.1.p1 GENE.GGOE01030409.1~~GGOE01030409.1.p1  ORF type:complete len:678 (+),score=225.27 GGOE01030409.1:43-2034(+)
MWDSSAYSHPLWRFHRFLDPALEAEYGRAVQRWALLPYRIYCVATLAIAVRCILVGPKGLSRPQLWPPVAAVTFSLVLLAVSFVSATLKRNVVAVHALSAMMLSANYMVAAYVNAMDYPNSWTGRSLAKLEDLLAGLHGEPYLGIVEDFVSTRWGFDASMEYIVLYSCSHWFTLILAGLNGWTVATYAFICTSMCASAMVMPYTQRDSRMGVVFSAVLLTLAAAGISTALEKVHRTSFLAEQLLTRELQASQMADSVLNHTLKNTLADVAANVEIFLAGNAPPSVLEDSIVCLRRGIRSCKQRQAFLKLVSGSYNPAINVVDLAELGQQLAAGRAVSVSFCDAAVFLDATLINLILENAITNAFKHGRPCNPGVTFTINQEQHTGLPTEFTRIVFRVSNLADPTKPELTPESVARLFAGRVRLQSRTPVPTLSDGVGLTHCLLAAQAGDIALSLTQEDDIVVFSAILTCKLCHHQLPADTPPHLLDLAAFFPSGLTFYCIDDSPSSLRLMEFYLHRWCQPAAVHCLGAKEADVYEFLALASANADVVILDQNLEYHRTYHGTDLARSLLSRGFTGLICIRSGDDAEEDHQRYLASGAHCCFGKDILGSRMVNLLKARYVELKRLGPHPFADLGDEEDVPSPGASLPLVAELSSTSLCDSEAAA